MPFDQLRRIVETGDRHSLVSCAFQSRKKQTREDSDDRHYDEELHKGEPEYFMPDFHYFFSCFKGSSSRPFKRQRYIASATLRLTPPISLYGVSQTSTRPCA